MIKFYCDKCGVEIIDIEEEMAQVGYKNKGETWQSWELCDSCFLGMRNLLARAIKV